MNNDYDLIIGLEVHLQSKTKSKMFCGCSAQYFNSKPNHHTCPVCFGLPGALPVPNREAIELCIKTALALNCKINNETKFDRKNYFYPDLPKGYQISQFDKPIGYNGEIDIETKEGMKKIGITRVHQEEDTGKSIHSGTETLLDFNKSGVPLIEIVSEPDFRTKEEVTTYCKRLRQIVRYLDISNADMEKGEMRFELNMSIRKSGDNKLPDYKVEVKNIASISVLEKVIDYEYNRQLELLENNETPKQETRGLVDMSGKTASQRSKETSADYRYFPEPDIPLIEIDDETVKRLENDICELPQPKKDRYISEFNLDSEIAEIIVSDVASYVEFESITSDIPREDIKELSKWYTGDYFALRSNQTPHKSFKPEYLRELVQLVLGKKITRANAKEVLETSYTTGVDISTIVKESGLEVVSDEGKLNEVVEKVFSSNPKAVEDSKANPNAAMFLVGQVMKEMKGQADAKTVQNIIFSKLKE